MCVVRSSATACIVISTMLGCGAAAGRGGDDAAGFQPTDVDPPDDDGDSTVEAPFTGTPQVVLPESRLDASQLVVLVNLLDQQSVEVAQHYVAARAIPEENVIALSFPPGSKVMAPSDFTSLYAETLERMPSAARAFAITWTQPYRVGGMSITSAFALGYDAKYTNTTDGACGVTAYVPTYDGDTRGWQGLNVRPAMMLAGASVDNVEAVVDRGVAADSTFPSGSAWLIRTTQQARSVRWPQFAPTETAFAGSTFVDVHSIDNASGRGANYVTDISDMLFYFQALVAVPEISSNVYLPGAIADHLTSFGGQVPTSGQMSVVRWLEVGATGSAGTVVEPCAYTQKFPNVGVVMRHYVRGETLLEAYWKSVAWPGELLFVGEPLARPWGTEVEATPEHVRIRTNALIPGRTYELRAKTASDATTWTVVWSASVSDTTPVAAEVIIEVSTEAPFYELVAADP